MEETEERSLESWDNNDINFDLSRLDQLEGDAVSIQCVNSSEFVIGKQTNFNGPVTIINCANEFNSKKERIGEGKEEDEEEEEEKIVIKDRVLSKKAETMVQKMGGNNCNKEGLTKTNESGKLDEKFQYLLGWLARDFLKIPVGVWILIIGILGALALILTMTYIKSEMKDDERKTAICPQLIVRSQQKFCIYSEFSVVLEEREMKMELKEPVAYLVVSQTQGSFCYSHEFCVDIMKSRLKGVSDEGSFPCNFLIGGDGNIYEEGGWKSYIELEGFALGKNYQICFIGDFNNGDFPTYPQVEASKGLIEFGIEKAFIEKDYVLVASNATVTDGTRDLGSIYKVIRKWSHFKENPFKFENSKINSSESKETLHRIYTKAEWKGLPPTSTVEMKLPVPYVIISHSGTPQCTDFEDCASFIRNVQAFHMSQGSADITYNFLVDSDGNIYEGRGWSKRNVIEGFVNNRNIDINFLGDYSRDLDPTSEQIASVKFLIEYGLKNGKISKNYSLIPASATYPTLSPGKNVYKIIKNWSHFDANPISHIKDYDE